MGKYLYNPDYSVIGLHIDLLRLPATIEIEGDPFFLKSEFHVTLIAPGKILEKYNFDIPDFYNKIVADFQEFVKVQSVEFIRFSGEFRLVNEADKKTLIGMCEVSALNSFFDAVIRTYLLSLDYPPLHVTLYTLQPDRGIFVTDMADINEKTRLITAPASLNDINAHVSI